MDQNLPCLIPKEQFRGWFIPVEIVQLFECRSLSALEVLLLAEVDSYVDQKEGFLGTDKELGLLIGISKQATAKMVQRLLELGLLLDVSVDGWERELIAVYSRPRLFSGDQKTKPINISDDLVDMRS